MITHIDIIKYLETSEVKNAYEYLESLYPIKRAVDASYVVGLGRALGFSRKEVHDARRALGIKSVRTLIGQKWILKR